MQKRWLILFIFIFALFISGCSQYFGETKGVNVQGQQAQVADTALLKMMDEDGNGIIGQGDVDKFSIAFQSGQYDAGYDYDANGAVDTDDFFLFSQYWDYDVVTGLPRETTTTTTSSTTTSTTIYIPLTPTVSETAPRLTLGEKQYLISPCYGPKAVTTEGVILDCSKKQEVADEYCKRVKGVGYSASSFEVGTFDSRGGDPEMRGGTVYLPSEKICDYCEQYFKAIACGGQAVTPAISFSISPAQVTAGSVVENSAFSQVNVIASWDVKYADSCNLIGPDGNIVSANEVYVRSLPLNALKIVKDGKVSPIWKTEGEYKFTLRCNGKGGQIEETKVVKVVPISKPPKPQPATLEALETKYKGLCLAAETLGMASDPYSGQVREGEAAHIYCPYGKISKVEGYWVPAKSKYACDNSASVDCPISCGQGCVGKSSCIIGTAEVKGLPELYIEGGYYPCDPYELCSTPKDSMKLIMGWSCEPDASKVIEGEIVYKKDPKLYKDLFTSDRVNAYCETLTDKPDVLFGFVDYPGKLPGVNRGEVVRRILCGEKLVEAIVKPTTGGEMKPLCSHSLYATPRADCPIGWLVVEAKGYLVPDIKKLTCNNFDENAEKCKISCDVTKCIGQKFCDLGWSKDCFRTNFNSICPEYSTMTAAEGIIKIKCQKITSYPT